MNEFFWLQVPVSVAVTTTFFYHNSSLCPHHCWQGSWVTDSSPRMAPPQSAHPSRERTPALLLSEELWLLRAFSHFFLCGLGLIKWNWIHSSFMLLVMSQYIFFLVLSFPCCFCHLTFSFSTEDGARSFSKMKKICLI
jgi:hypothetical protein